VSLLCQDARVFEAMEQAGTPCPYKGKIGIEAAKAWAENPEKRPDYDKWLKGNGLNKEESDLQIKSAKILACGSRRDKKAILKLRRFRIQQSVKGWQICICIINIDTVIFNYTS